MSLMSIIYILIKTLKLKNKCNKMGSLSMVQTAGQNLSSACKCPIESPAWKSWVAKITPIITNLA